MSPLLFDEPYYIEINEARWKMARRAIDLVRKQAPGGLTTCADVAAGPGWFSEKLGDIGLAVTGIEGRLELIEAAAQRVPNAHFVQANVESGPEMQALGTFDLVFCFGLLYHTENPFAVVRNLAAVTGTVLFIETQVLPTDEPILRIVSEGQNETQGLTFHSIIASRTALVKMLQTAGFSWVAEYTGSVGHADFHDTQERHRRRGVYLAARQPFQVPDFRALPPAQAPKYDFAKAPRR